MAIWIDTESLIAWSSNYLIAIHSNSTNTGQ